MAHPLIEQLLTLISKGKTADQDQAFEQWQQRCSDTLQTLPEDQRKDLITELQRVVAENLELVKSDNQQLVTQLVEGEPSSTGTNQAKHYQQVSKL